MTGYYDYESAPFEPALPSPDCTLIAPLLTAYFDREAPGVHAVRVQHHLANCARCAQMWRDWGDTRALLHTMPTPAPPYTLASEIVQASRFAALLPQTAVVSSLARAGGGDERSVPPQLQEAILAATVGAAPIAALDSLKNAPVECAVAPHRLARSYRASRAWAAMAAVPALALWLIVATANHSPSFAPQNSGSEAALAVVVAEPVVSQVPHAHHAAPLSAPVHIAAATTPAPHLIASTREETIALAVPKLDDQMGQSALPAAAPLELETSTNVPDFALATPRISPNLTINLRATQPMSAPDLSAPTSVVRANGGAVIASPAARIGARTAMVARTVAPRRSARLTTVAMETPALSSAPRSLMATNELPRMALALASPQKATLPLATSRDTDEDNLWQSDVTDGSALSVVQALNDNRPRELRDAFDAYARTLIDDSDAPAATL